MTRNIVMMLSAMVVAGVSRSDVATGPSPDAYHVVIRYSIDALRTERVRQFDEMSKLFAKAGFRRDDEPPENEAIDRRFTRMMGTIPAKGVPLVTTQRHVRCVLLWPKDSKLPDGDGRVRVELYLANGFTPETQRLIARQTALALGKAGFVEAFGYDAEAGSKLVGSMPASKLELALEDPRAIPEAGGIPGPFRNLQTIRAIIARPDWPVPTSRPSVPAVPPEEEKYSPDLAAALKAGRAEAPGRIEVLLAYTPADTDRTWLDIVRQGGASVEGRIGPLVSLAAVPKIAAPELAKQPSVLAIRLPRSARRAPSVKSNPPTDWSPLRRSGVAQLHTMARRGAGTRIAVLADDFTGWDLLPGVKEKRVRHIDLSSLRHPQLDPNPPGKGDGARYARSVIEVAPEAEVILLRVPPDAPYMVQNIARIINGEPARFYLLDERLRELLAARDRVSDLRDNAARLRAIYLDDPREDEEGLKRRKAFDDAEAAFKKLEAEVRQRSTRWFDLDRDLRSLKGVRVVASTLVWADGFPVDGSSALSRYFDDQPFKSALWFQAAGDTRGQSWSGLFRDEDGNGLMEIHSPGKRLPKGVWTPEIAWLSWQGKDGKSNASIDSGVLRVVLQWKEPHDPLPIRVGEDPYRLPLARMRTIVVRQFDPNGAKRPADDLEVIGQSAGNPIRLEQTATSATYEIVLDVKLPGPGRYGVMIEGAIPPYDSPPGEAMTPASRRSLEIRPRLFIDAPGAESRPIFADLPSDTAAFGMPADARQVLTVGAADANGDARTDGDQGSPYGASLVRRPDLLAYGLHGSGDAACFAAGMAATSANAKGSFASFVEAVRSRPGGLVVIPPSK